MFRKLGASMVLGSFLLAGAVAPSMARTSDRGCQRRIEKAEHNLQKAIRKHGANSSQAQHRRQQLEQIRSTCRVRNHDRHDHDRDHR